MQLIDFNKGILFLFRTAAKTIAISSFDVSHHRRQNIVIDLFIHEQSRLSKLEWLVANSFILEDAYTFREKNCLFLKIEFDEYIFRSFS